jgi:O-antigen ligase
VGWTASLLCVLIAQGVAVAHSYLWAGPIVCALVVIFATDIPIRPFLAFVLLVRVLTDATLSTPSAGSGTVNLSGGIAVLLILVAAGLVIQRRRGLLATTLATAWLCSWTAVGLLFHGHSSETARQGVREAAIVAVAVIVYNSRSKINMRVATGLVQLLGVVPAVLALYQLATHTGLNIEGHIRAYGTFNHPDGAAMFFAIASIASLWRYVDVGRRLLDLSLVALFAAATIATFSLTALASLLAMLVAFGALRPGSARLKLGSYAVAGLIVAVFLATPFGAARIANESSTQFNAAQKHALASTSLGWRLYKWETLIPEWEEEPFFGQGLGATVSAEGSSYMLITGKAPHNEYLRYLVETGAVGLIILLGAVVFLIRRLDQRRSLERNAGTLALAVVVGCLVNALADNTFLYTTTGYEAALIVAAALAIPAVRSASPAAREDLR